MAPRDGPGRRRVRSCDRYVSVRSTRATADVVVGQPAYTLRAKEGSAWAYLDGEAGPWAELCLFAQAETTTDPDETYAIDGPYVDGSANGGGSRLSWRLGSRLVRQATHDRRRLLGSRDPPRPRGRRGAARRDPVGWARRLAERPQRFVFSRRAFATVLPAAPGDPQRVVLPAEGVCRRDRIGWRRAWSTWLVLHAGAILVRGDTDADRRSDATARWPLARLRSRCSSGGTAIPGVRLPRRRRRIPFRPRLPGPDPSRRFVDSSRRYGSRLATIRMRSWPGMHTTSRAQAPCPPRATGAPIPAMRRRLGGVNRSSAAGAPSARQRPPIPGRS